MSSEVRVPALPESVADATVATWHKRPGDSVKREENLVDLETDKVVLEVPSPIDGILGEIMANEGDLVQSDAVLALIEASGTGATPPAGQASPPTQAAPAKAASASPAAKAASAGSAAKAAPAADAEPQVAPAARRLVKELNLDPHAIPGTGRDGRIHKADVIAYLDEREQAAPAKDPELALASPAPSPSLTGEAGRPEQRVPMTRLRARVAERLVQAQQNSAMLTTFNEVDLKAVLALRSRYKDQFEKTHAVRLGFMSFFVKAAVEALQRFPVINASVDGDDIIYHGYYDIGIAVSSPRGLVVPILRNCDQLSMADVEQGIVAFGEKAQNGNLSYEELTGGTFSITNGGVFGSLLSTPILNPPQSAILGMHKIQERPIADKGEIKIAPMMYLALTYDHRIIDGREAVQFLVSIKETLEDPARLLLRI
ncbi:2-oxoglutarate dehydrogenase complex dihydrolipoyllysine-residue succinyltransferase [Thiocapsa bogorovii]|uniref:2-oxoglutarate dehydrogenase complex dihydrolipoyllysine-residue succinyltransferase n=1 Tax=Thiocapsa bogorovii TaxID=521689 RepID=UPI001E3010FF|nr:2-oxoglutarate dehydrogenase complex dihydrolipoyllysine-residue succinyltransferase [Thiocapsa bogorovii]UHD15373.1 2-oxoglutarate dehydrogenase complex dihydrolipoyllysine-residue succinyltransferase [Thiocapsa bogorovii]